MDEAIAGMKEAALVSWLKVQRENGWPDAFKNIYLRAYREGVLCGHDMARATQQRVFQEFKERNK